MASPTAVLVRYGDPNDASERMAVAGFLAGYTGATRVSSATDLRLFAEWCANNGVRLLDVKRARLELYARHLEANGGCLDGRPLAVDTGQLLPLLPRRRRAAAEPGGQRASPQGGSRVAHNQTTARCRTVNRRNAVNTSGSAVTDSTASRPPAWISRARRR